MAQYPPAFIEDGYTRKVEIDGVEGVYPPCKFTYRPMTGKEYTNWFAMVFAGTSDTDADILAMIAERIKSWGLEPPVTAESLRKMNSQLFSRILKIVMGTEAPDREADGTTEADRDTEAADAGN